MRLNIENYQSILTQKQLSDEYVQKATGLSQKTYLWILDRGFIEEETLERIADAVGCPVGEIICPDYEGYSENVIEWVKDGKRATLTLSQRRIITRVKQLAEKYPQEVQILAENKNGSVYAHVPTEWIRINPGKELTEEQRTSLAERAKHARQNIGKTDYC